MCTLSWIREGAGYELHFNRDERRSRRPATPPARGQRGGIRFLAPRDGDAGGSWISVNDRGLSLCLLNRYGDETLAGQAPVTSRGLLLISLADSVDLAELERRLAGEPLPRFQPFDLVAFSPGSLPRRAGWDGRHLRLQDLGAADLPLTSSSFEDAAVIPARRESFRQVTGLHSPDSELLRAFHASHLPEKGPSSVCMHREDASTVSYCKVRVDPERVEISYVAGPPCEGETPVIRWLPRAMGAL